MRTKMTNESLTALGKMGLLLLVPLLLVLIPTSWLEGRRTLCPIKALTGRNCPGCGMTRATSSALHGNFKQALRYNRLVVIMLPILAYQWLQMLSREYRSYRALTGR